MQPIECVHKYPFHVGGKIVSTLAGWSLGRVGVLYELEYLSAVRSPMLSNIKYVLMIDPAVYGELAASCDTAAGYTWLRG